MSVNNDKIPFDSEHHGETGACKYLAGAASEDWYLAGAACEDLQDGISRGGESGQAPVRHVPNPASGGEPIQIEIEAFLSKDRGSPQRQELMRMIGSLVPEALDPDRT
jgi:hypothetical protein